MLCIEQIQMRRVTWCCLTVTQLFNVKEGSQSEYMISWCGLKTLQCVFEGSVLMVLKWLWVSAVKTDDDLKSRSEDEEPVLRSAAFLAFPVETWDWGAQRLSYGKVGEHWEKLVNLNEDFHFLSFLFLIIFQSRKKEEENLLPGSQISVESVSPDAL